MDLGATSASGCVQSPSHENNCSLMIRIFPAHRLCCRYEGASLAHNSKMRVTKGCKFARSFSFFARRASARSLKPWKMRRPVRMLCSNDVCSFCSCPVSGWNAKHTSYVFSILEALAFKCPRCLIVVAADMTFGSNSARLRTQSLFRPHVLPDTEFRCPAPWQEVLHEV